MQVPYFSQWESADLAPELVAGTATLREDPLWRASGAVTQDEYIEWANHVCGMACLKMVLAARLGRVEPTLTLARLATRYGAYEVGPQNIRGMIYAPFVAMLSAEYGLAAEVKTALPARALPACWTAAVFTWRRCMIPSGCRTARRRAAAAIWC